MADPTFKSEDTATSTTTAAVPSSSTNTEQLDDRPRHQKRTRAAMDPGTPKGEEGEPKGLTSSTPLAKKGRVQDDDTPREEEGSPQSDQENGKSTTPPPSSSALPPSTPATTVKQDKVPSTEGKETKHIRERVAAMKASGSGQGESQDVDIAEVSGGEESKLTTREGKEEQDKEMKAAEVASEVSVTAARLGDQEEKKEDQDTEIAEIAAEVSKSAEEVNEKEQAELTGRAKVAAEVNEVAQEIQKEDTEIADTAAETAQVAQEVPETKAAKSTSFVPYTGSGGSSFSSFSSTSSPFASVSTPAKAQPLPPAPAPVETQKPKTKTAFSASPFLSSSIPLAKKPETISNSTSPSAPSSSTLAPSTPSAKPLSSNSPFSAFASTSGFASSAAKKSAPLGGGGGGGFGTPSSAFSSYSAAPSAFASVPSTPSSKSPLPPSTSSAAATNEDEPSSTEESGSTGRKMGEPEQPDENKRIYTERETHTGEEEDKVIHNVRAKLYAMQDGNWVERGMGPLKVNLTKREGEKEGARIVMRADATHRLLLNSPLFKEFFIEVSNEKYVRFTIIEGSEPISYMARLGNPAAAEALVSAVRERTNLL